MHGIHFYVRKMLYTTITPNAIPPRPKKENRKKKVLDQPKYFDRAMLYIHTLSQV
jgi:hypothetical protein